MRTHGFVPSAASTTARCIRRSRSTRSRAFPRRFTEALAPASPSEDNDAVIRTRPAPDVWSALEYAAHVADSARRRSPRSFSACTTEDKPDDRVLGSRRAGQSPTTTTNKPKTPCSRAWPAAPTRLVEEAEQRRRQRLDAHRRVSRGANATCSIMLQNAVHEGVHHLKDVENGLERGAFSAKLDSEPHAARKLGPCGDAADRARRRLATARIVSAPTAQPLRRRRRFPSSRSTGAATATASAWPRTARSRWACRHDQPKRSCSQFYPGTTIGKASGQRARAGVHRQQRRARLSRRRRDPRLARRRRTRRLDPADEVRAGGSALVYRDGDSTRVRGCHAPTDRHRRLPPRPRRPRPAHRPPRPRRRRPPASVPAERRDKQDGPQVASRRPRSGVDDHDHGTTAARLPCTAFTGHRRRRRTATAASASRRATAATAA